MPATSYICIILAILPSDATQSAALLSHVVCPSICPYVTLVDCDHIDWDNRKV